jgi:hypothetical protein
MFSKPRRNAPNLEWGASVQSYFFRAGPLLRSGLLALRYMLE